MQSSVLISSFEPFGGEEINPSQEVTRALSSRYHTVELPVSHQQASERLIAKIDELSPTAVIMLGEAGGSEHITPERVAINADDFRIPDHAGYQPKGDFIITDGPAAYFSTLPIYEITDELTAAEIPAKISNSAGTYVCNHLFYKIRHYLEAYQPCISAGFIHLPYLPVQIANKPNGTSSLSLQEMILGIELAINVCDRKEQITFT